MINIIEKLTQNFSRFPGIGPRQAKRFVYFLLSKNDFFLNELAENILELKKEVLICESCCRFFQSKIFTNARLLQKCDICSDKNRDDSVLMVVGKDTDLENIEKTNVYNGKYFILGGYIPIINKKNNYEIREKELTNLIKKSKNLKEVILALNANPDGENTASYLFQILKPLAVKITSLGRGLSTGTELEYSDDDTLKNALKNRS